MHIGRWFTPRRCTWIIFLLLLTCLWDRVSDSHTFVSVTDKHQRADHCSYSLSGTWSHDGKTMRGEMPRPKSPWRTGLDSHTKFKYIIYLQVQKFSFTTSHLLITRETSKPTDRKVKGSLENFTIHTGHNPILAGLIISCTYGIRQHHHWNGLSGTQVRNIVEGATSSDWYVTPSPFMQLRLGILLKDHQ